MKSSEAIKEVLNQYPGWKQEGDYLLKTFVFSSFEEAIQSMQELVLPINQLNHHPEWQNIFNRVEVKLTTHDSGCVTEKDIELLILIEKHWSKVK